MYDRELHLPVGCYDLLRAILLYTASYSCSPRRRVLYVSSDARRLPPLAGNPIEEVMIQQNLIIINQVFGNYWLCASTDPGFLPPGSRDAELANPVGWF